MLHATLAQSAQTFWLPRGTSTVSAGVDNLFNVILWICVFFFLLVTILLVAFVIKYRHRPGVQRDTFAGHNTTLEITWTVIPSIIVVFLYYYGFKEYMNLAIEPPNAYEVIVTGQMWQWKFGYPNGYEDPELHIPLHTPIRAILQSNDVIHSLSLPEFRVKKDVVPGRYNRMWFDATSANGHAYLTSVMINGKPVEIAVDPNGDRLPETQAPFSAAPAPVQAGLGTQPGSGGGGGGGGGGGQTIAPTQLLQVFTLHDGRSIYVMSGAANVAAIDANGASPSGTVQFSALPDLAQRAVKEAAQGAAIAETQPVRVFDDAESFDIFCAAYCGTNHSVMRSHVIVHRTFADFQRWLTDAAAKANNLTPPERGKKLYTTQGCAQCHSLDGSKVVGPSWKDVFGSMVELEGHAPVLADEAYIRESILLPQAKIVKGFGPQMPPFAMKDADINAIIAFMKTISSHVSQSPASPTTGPTTAPTTRPAAGGPVASVR